MNSMNTTLVCLLFLASAAVGQIPYPGTNGDLILLTGIDAPPSTGSGQFVKSAGLTDVLNASIESPAGTQTFQPIFLFGQFFLSGMPPSNPFIADLWVGGSGQTAALILVGRGQPGPYFIDVLLSPGGHHVSWVLDIPPFLAGTNLMLQGASLDPTAPNGFSHLTSGHEIRF